MAWRFKLWWFPLFLRCTQVSPHSFCSCSAHILFFEYSKPVLKQACSKPLFPFFEICFQISSRFTPWFYSFCCSEAWEASPLLLNLPTSNVMTLWHYLSLILLFIWTQAVPRYIILIIHLFIPLPSPALWSKSWENNVHLISFWLPPGCSQFFV